MAEVSGSCQRVFGSRAARLAQFQGDHLDILHRDFNIEGHPDHR